MKIEIDRDDTLTDIKDSLTKAAQEYAISLNKNIENKEIELTFGGIDIDTKVIRKEYGVNEVPYVEAEIVSDGE